MPKAACYCRVSTSKESQLDSLDKQHDFFRAFFKNHPEYELYELYTDEGISAKSMKRRAAFTRMIRDAREKKFDIIFVKDVSRFSRNARDFFNALDQVTRAGVKISFITLDMTSEPANEFMLGLLALVAQEESANLSKKTKFGKDVTAARGRVPNFVFGYDRVDNYTLAPNETEAEWVRKIFGMYVREELGTAKIAERLNALGVPSKKRNVGAWTQNTVCQMLKNELYIGKVVNRKSEVVDFREGKRRKRGSDERTISHRPEFRIVSDELFAKAAELMAARNDAFHSLHKRASVKYTLSNLLVCASDGYAFRRCTRKNAHGGRNAYWVCSYRNAKGASSCANEVRVDEEALCGVIFAFLENAALGKERIIREAAKLVLDECTLRAGGADRAAMEREMRRLEQKHARFAELYADGLLSKEGFAEHARAVDERRKTLEAAIAKCGRAPDAASIERAVRAFVEGMDASILTNPLLKALFERIVVHPDGRVQALVAADGAAVEIPLALAGR